MSKAPKPKANDYAALPVDQWTAAAFLAYLCDEHERLFGVKYAPYGGWGAERGRLADIVGTARKEPKYDRHLIKRFIDECFVEYRPTAQYPGTNFGFMWTWKQAVLQRLEREQQRKAHVKESIEQLAELDEGWF